MSSHNQSIHLKFLNCSTYHILGISTSNYSLHFDLHNPIVSACKHNKRVRQNHGKFPRYSQNLIVTMNLFGLTLGFDNILDKRVLHQLQAVSCRYLRLFPSLNQPNQCNAFPYLK